MKRTELITTKIVVAIWGPIWKAYTIISIPDDGRLLWEVLSDRIRFGRSDSFMDSAFSDEVIDIIRKYQLDNRSD